MDKTTHEARLNYLRQFYAENRPPYTGQNIIPESVLRDYEPSGKIAYQTIPLMLLAGLAGAGAGYIAHLLLSELGFGIFTATFDSGGCFSIIILFAGILVIFSPLAIPILSAIFVNLAAPRSKCRSFRLATILGILGGLICSVGGNLYFGQFNLRLHEPDC